MNTCNQAHRHAGSQKNTHVRTHTCMFPGRCRPRALADPGHRAAAADNVAGAVGVVVPSHQVRREPALAACATLWCRVAAGAVVFGLGWLRELWCRVVTEGAMAYGLGWLRELVCRVAAGDPRPWPLGGERAACWGPD